MEACLQFSANGFEELVPSFETRVEIEREIDSSSPRDDLEAITEDMATELFRSFGISVNVEILRSYLKEYY